MKKNKLIEMLSKIEGNPDILLWNGYVKDWMDIEPVIAVDTLTKMTFKTYCDIHRIERIHQQGFPDDYTIPENQIQYLKETYKKRFEWEINPFITADDIKNKRYSKKQVFYMQPKLRGKSDSQRGNKMEY